MYHHFRPYLTLLYDGSVATIAFALALILRYDGIPPGEALTLLYIAPVYGAVCMAIFALLGLNLSVWRYTGSGDLVRLAEGVVATLIVVATGLFILTRLENFPRSAFIILWLLHMALAAGPRLSIRLMRENIASNWNKGPKQRQHALLIGANDTADMFLRELARQNPKPYTVHGILDDDEAKKGRLIHNIPVHGSIATLPMLVDKLKRKGITIDLLILTEKVHAQHDTILQTAQRENATLRRLPNMQDMAEGEPLTNLKPVLIEDLLGRQQRTIDLAPINELIKSKTVLITGAGGSIGSELVRQIAAQKPAHIILADHSELALYSIDHELNLRAPDIPRTITMVDVRNQANVSNLFNTHTIDLVFHAAAYKHVPLVEANPVAGITTNLLGTICVAEAAAAHKVPNMVVISTDKAVNPTNVMGATKRAAEIYCQNHPGPTNFTTVRFGNVLGSTGSVIPLFTRQIQEGGPITVTDKRAMRYFMTIPEAVQLTLRAAALGAARAEESDVFMLDMGEAVNIWHVAEEMVRLSGLVPHVDIEIKETGLRPGEKLAEELWYDAETFHPTDVKEVFRVEPQHPEWKEIQKQVETLKTACDKANAQQTITALKQMVPEYIPASNSPYAQKSRKKTS